MDIRGMYSSASFFSRAPLMNPPARLLSIRTSGHGVTDVEHLRQLVGDTHDGRAVRLQLADQAEESSRLVLAECRRKLVHEKNAGARVETTLGISMSCFWATLRSLTGVDRRMLACRPRRILSASPRPCLNAR
jgi:hypothetical protein